MKKIALIFILGLSACPRCENEGDLVECSYRDCEGVIQSTVVTREYCDTIQQDVDESCYHIDGGMK